MKILAGNIKSLADSLGKVVSEMPLEIDAACKLIHVAQEVAIAQQAFETRRMQLLDEWGEKDRDGKLVTTNGLSGGPVKFEEGKEEGYAQAYSIIANEDRTFGFDLIPLELLTQRASGKPYTDSNGDPITILPAVLLGLMPIIEDETGDGKADSE